MLLHALHQPPHARQGGTDEERKARDGIAST
jgi:hypothetical protein